jgi:hypothetical protein
MALQPAAGHQTVGKVPTNRGDFVIIGHVKKRYETQAQIKFFSIEKIVPQDHLLRKIHKIIS